MIHSGLTLSSDEVVYLKSIALGLTGEMIQNLLEIDINRLQKLSSSLFDKLAVSNSYTAVRKAYQMNLLKEKEYCPDKIKALALETASDKMNESSLIFGESKKTLWELYDFLLEFNMRLETSYGLKNAIDIK